MALLSATFNRCPFRLRVKLRKLRFQGRSTALFRVFTVSLRESPSGNFAAWLGLVPRQYSTGGKPRLGRITKRGDKYLRTLLIHGTRAVIAKLANKDDRLSRWAKELVERRGYKRAAVALAAKNARIIWALLMNQTEFKTQPVEG